MNSRKTFPVLVGAEEIGVVILTDRGFEAHHQALGYYQAIECARSAVFERVQRESAA